MPGEQCCRFLLDTFTFALYRIFFDFFAIVWSVFYVLVRRNTVFAMPEKMNNIPLESSRQCQYEEIYLMDLVDVIVRKKNLFFFITAFITSAAIAYSLFSPDNYRLEMAVSPVSSRALQQINGNIDNKFNFTSEEVFNMFIKIFQSLKTVQEGNKSLDGLTPEESKLLEDIRLEFPGKRDTGGLIKIAIEGQKPAVLTTVLNKYMDAVNRVAVANILEQMDLWRKNQIDILALEIEEGTEYLQYSQQLRLKELQDALLVARKAGIKKTHEILPGDYPLYLLGEDVLQAEIDILQSFMNDASLGTTSLGLDADKLSLQSEILQKQLKLKTLQNTKYEVESLQIVDVAGNAPSLPQSLKPGVKKVIVFSLFAALLLSLFSVFVVSFFESYARRKKNICM